MGSGSFSDGDMFEVSGWGTTSEGGDTSSTLRMVSVPYVDDATCDSAYGSYGGIVADVMLCAGEAGKDSCQGHSMANMSVLFLGELDVPVLDSLESMVKLMLC